MNTTSSRQGLLTYFILAFFSIVALGIRFIGFPVYSADYNVLYSWYLEITAPGPGIDSLLAYTGDYPMPYASLIWLLGKLPFPFWYSLKGVNVLIDFAQAILAGKIVQTLIPERRNGFLLGYLIVLFLPNVVLNGSYWGQCDGTYTMFLLAAFYCVLKKKYVPMMLMLGLAFSFKLQSVFILPFILLLYWLNREFSILHFLIVPATMMAMNIPAVIAGYSPMITFTQYARQAGGFPWLYYFYPNLWFFFQAGPYYLFSTGAVMLSIAALLIFVLMLIKRDMRITRGNMIFILLWTAYTCVFFLPSMHERYGYFVELIAVLATVIYLRAIWIPAGMILCTFPKYLFALGVGGNPVGLQMAEAMGNTFIYIVFTCVFWRELFQKRQSDRPTAERAALPADYAPERT